ncbi:MAG: PorV/PorQ family protein [Saprospiraceae bacterium]|nr:PorV/PorQ family protein [Saprospiraceae bacterium]
MHKKLLIFFVSVGFAWTCFAGNPDRQGEAGAYELLMNPWPRSAALNSLNCSRVGGIEAMMLNPAGLSRINQWELGIAQGKWLEPSGISLSSGAFVTRVGKNGSLGIALMSLNIGDLRVTTNANPEGTGATYSPTFSNIALGYSHLFGNRISVGFLVRGISESIQDLSAFGMSLDAGVQYVTGENNNFKFGISLRNIGGPMSFGGDGLSAQLKSPENTDLTYSIRLTRFELPSQLNIGISYDFLISDQFNLTPMANFTSNSFGRDEVGLGLDARLTDYLGLRVSYKSELGEITENETKTAHTGLAAGLSVSVPLKKKSENRLAVDYGYRHSDPFQGTHQLGLRLEF